MTKNPITLVLASQSPRRAELLTQAGFQFTVKAPAEEIEAEASRQAEQNLLPEALVLHLAKCKAENVAQQIKADSHRRSNSRANERVIVLAADTVAVCEGEVLGKPLDRADALRMLTLMSGKTHQVLTGVCLWDLVSDQNLLRLTETRLRMDVLASWQLEEFLQTEDWRGKAGGFGYQDGLSWLHIERGLASNVVGLPVELIPAWIGQLCDPHESAATR